MKPATKGKPHRSFRKSKASKSSGLNNALPEQNKKTSANELTADEIARLVDAQRREREAKSEIKRIMLGQQAELHSLLQNDPPKEQAYALLQFHSLLLEADISTQEQVLLRLHERHQEASRRLAELEKDPTLCLRDPVESHLKAFSRIVPAPPNYRKLDRVVYNIGGYCKQCGKPYRWTKNKGELQRFCSNACKMKRYRQRKKALRSKAHKQAS